MGWQMLVFFLVVFFQGLLGLGGWYSGNKGSFWSFGDWLVGGGGGLSKVVLLYEVFRI